MEEQEPEGRGTRAYGSGHTGRFPEARVFGQSRSATRGREPMVAQIDKHDPVADSCRAAAEDLSSFHEHDDPRDPTPAAPPPVDRTRRRMHRDDTRVRAAVRIDRARRHRAGDRAPGVGHDSADRRPDLSRNHRARGRCDRHRSPHHEGDRDVSRAVGTARAVLPAVVARHAFAFGATGSARGTGLRRWRCRARADWRRRPASHRLDARSAQRLGLSLRHPGRRVVAELPLRLPLAARRRAGPPGHDAGHRGRPVEPGTAVSRRVRLEPHRRQAAADAALRLRLRDRARGRGSTGRVVVRLSAHRRRPDRLQARAARDAD